MNPPSTRPPIPFIASADYAHTADWISALQAAMPEEKILPLSQLTAEQRIQAELAIVANPDPAELQALPALRWVHSVWAGVERLLADLQGSQWHDLPIVRLVDPQLAATMAEAVLAWCLYLHRDMPRYARQQRAHLWQSGPYRTAASRRISLLGLGELGSKAAQVLLQQGFTVNGWARSAKQLAGVQCFSGMDGLQAMLAQTDILVCLLPLTADTEGLLNRQTLGWLPADASLINFGRGAIIADADLKNQLDQHLLSHAVLDVFSKEPLAADSWHWDHPAVTVLPHCSAPTDKQTASLIVAGNIHRFRLDGSLPAAVARSRGY